MKKYLLQKNKAYPQCLKHSFCRRGFTLVETLVSISIFTLSILGLISILASGIADTNYAKQKMVASYLAQEGIEYVRNMRDSAVLYPLASSPPVRTWITFKGAVGTLNYPTTSDFPGFIRTISADTTSFGADEIKITSDVSWKQGSGTYHITFSENLFNWIE